MLALFAFFLVNYSLAQEVGIMIKKDIIGDNSKTFIIQSEDAYLLFGTTNTSNSYLISNQFLQDIFMVEINQGDKIIKNRIISLPGIDELVSVIHTKDDCYLLLIEKSHLNYYDDSTLLIKIDNGMDIIWQNQFNIAPINLAEDSKSDLLLIGANRIDATSKTYEEQVLVKCKSDGDEIYRKTIDSSIFSDNFIFSSIDLKKPIFGSINRYYSDSLRNINLGCNNLGIVDPYDPFNYYPKYYSKLTLMNNSGVTLKDTCFHFPGLLSDALFDADRNEFICFGNVYTVNQRTINAFYDNQLKIRPSYSCKSEISAINLNGMITCSKDLCDTALYFYDNILISGLGVLSAYRDNQTNKVCVELVNYKDGIFSSTFKFNVPNSYIFIYNVSLFLSSSNEIMVFISQRRKDDEKMLSDLVLLKLDLHGNLIK